MNAKEQFYPQFNQVLKSMSHLPDSEIRKLFESGFLMKIQKGEYFVKAYTVSRKIGFNLNGLFRLFYTHENGDEFTKGFVRPNYMTLSYSALEENRESYFSIQAMKDCDMLVFDYDEWWKLIKAEPGWFELLYNFVKKTYMFKERREKEFLLNDATERYLQFLEEFGPFLKDIKQYHVASYLGITPVALSRIKKAIEKSKN